MAAPLPVIRAAGAVLWRRAPDGGPPDGGPADGNATGLEFALVHRPARQDWSLPKGKLEAGEHAVTAAVREVREETGAQIALGRPLTTLRYLVDGQRKQVRYWSAQVGAAAEPAESASPAEPERPADPAEIDEVEWLPYEQARSRLTYPHDARLLREVWKAPVDTTPLVLLRHGKAVKRAAWHGTVDHARPLEGRGIGQARRLVPMLAAFGVDTVVSSDATRCRDTVLPYARAHGLATTEEPLLSEEGHAHDPHGTRRLARALLADPAALVICSHRPVLPDLLAQILTEWHGRPPHPLGPGAFLVLHRDLSGRHPHVVAVERHRP